MKSEEKVKPSNKINKNKKLVYEYKGIKVGTTYSKMTNLDKWRFYNKDCTSPDSYIDFSFYAMIAAALQRKVWIGTLEEKPLFPNLYTIFVGPPGVGKGLAIGPVERTLRFWKKDPKEKDLFNKNSQDEKDYKDIEKLKKGEVPLLIQVGASATTFEKLVSVMASSNRGLFYNKDDNTKGVYFHSSLSLCLSEISSMFRKHTEDVVNFLLCAYDCEDYRYDTISRGTDCIRNCCLNLVGGTTPEFIREVFKDELLSTGFASRTIFVCETKPRSYRACPPEYSPEQIKCRDDVRDHVKKLASLFGQIQLTPETKEYIEAWWLIQQKKKTNKSTKLENYYARKNITVQKLAMAYHFADSLTFELDTFDIKAAGDILDSVEKNMHIAVTVKGKENKLSSVTDNIYDYLVQCGPRSNNEIYIEFYGELENHQKSLDTIINYLTRSGKIKLNEERKYQAEGTFEI